MKGSRSAMRTSGVRMQDLTRLPSLSPLGKDFRVPRVANPEDDGSVSLEDNLIVRASSGAVAKQLPNSKFDGGSAEQFDCRYVELVADP